MDKNIVMYRNVYFNFLFCFYSLCIMLYVDYGRGLFFLFKNLKILLDMGGIWKRFRLRILFIIYSCIKIDINYNVNMF